MLYTMSSERIETREKILQAAVRKLEESGGRGVRMGDIARETGISRQAVYLHFATRTGIFGQEMNRIVNDNSNTQARYD